MKPVPLAQIRRYHVICLYKTGSPSRVVTSVNTIEEARAYISNRFVNNTKSTYAILDTVEVCTADPKPVPMVTRHIDDIIATIPPEQRNDDEDDVDEDDDEDDYDDEDDMDDQDGF